MTKIIRFLGEAILVLADIFKLLSNMVRFMVVIGICVGVLMFTLLATFEALHFVQPMEYIPEYGRQLDIFNTDFWAWVVAVLGWTTMIYGAVKMVDSDKEYNKHMELNKETNSTWLGDDNF